VMALGVDSLGRAVVARLYGVGEFDYAFGGRLAVGRPSRRTAGPGGELSRDIASRPRAQWAENPSRSLAGAMSRFSSPACLNGCLIICAGWWLHG
jgi:hypothetical protein